MSLFYDCYKFGDIDIEFGGIFKYHSVLQCHRRSCRRLVCLWKGISYEAENQSCTLLINTLENLYISCCMDLHLHLIVSCLYQRTNLFTVMLSKPGKAQYSYILVAVLFGPYCNLSKSKSFSKLLWQILHWNIALQFSRVAKEYCNAVQLFSQLCECVMSSCVAFLSIPNRHSHKRQNVFTKRKHQTKQSNEK